jgi:hypothetical protein
LSFLIFKWSCTFFLLMLPSGFNKDFDLLLPPSDISTSLF